MNATPSFVALVVRPTLILLVASLIASAMRDGSAASRHFVWSVALIAALLVPVAGFYVPAVNVLPVAGRGPTSTPGGDLLPTLVWIAGASAIAGVRIRRLARLWQAEREASTPEDPRLATMVESGSRRLGVRRSVRLLLGGPGDMPVTWGWWQARVLLPAGAEAWPDGQTEVVLLHELAHVRRADILLQRVAEVASVLLWFNPLTWYALRRMAVEREYACDDAVLRSGVEGPEYAHQLLALSRHLRQARRPTTAVAFASGPSQMEGRLHAILDDTKARSTRPGVAAFIVFGTAALIALSTAAIQAQPLPGAAGPALSASTPAQTATERFHFRYRFDFDFDLPSNDRGAGTLPRAKGTR